MLGGGGEIKKWRVDGGEGEGIEGWWREGGRW